MSENKLLTVAKFLGLALRQRQRLPGQDRRGAWTSARVKTTCSFAVLMFFVGVGYAQATVIYDWVTLGRNIRDSGYYSLKASVAITDQEYINGSFSTPGAIGDTTFSASLQTRLTGGSLWERSFPSYFFDRIYGLLSYDRTSILGFGSINRDDGSVYGYSCTGTILTFWDDNGSGTVFSATSGAGDLMFPNMYFDRNNPPLFDVWTRPTCDVYGEWVLREDSLPTPEPSTFILLGAGVAGMALWLRRKRTDHHAS